MKTITAPDCIELYVTSLANRRPVGSFDGERPVRWDIDTRETGTVWIAHDGTEYELPLVPIERMRGGSFWMTVCPTCQRTAMKLWLAPDRSLFQCRICARVTTWHRLDDKQLTDIGIIGKRIQRLRARHNPVRGRYERTVSWYRRHARIVELEDKLLELASQLANTPRN